MSYYSEAIARHIVTHTAAEGKEEYQKFFQAALKKFGVSSPAGLSPDKKKDFFNYMSINTEKISYKLFYLVKNPILKNGI